MSRSDQGKGKQGASGSGGRTFWIAVGVTIVVVGGLAASAGARFGSATMGLFAVAGALGLCLRSLYKMTNALRQPAVEVELAQQGALEVASQRQLREEKRRLVRAINELTFDHEMGKLSKEDYDAVRQVYELKAVEVMRALDSDAALHPALKDVLAQLEGTPKAKAEPETTPEAEPETTPEAEPEAKAKAEPETTTPEAEPADEAQAHEDAEAADDDAPAAPDDDAPPTCRSCGIANDEDAKFCKSCGKELEKA